MIDLKINESRILNFVKTITKLYGYDEESRKKLFERIERMDNIK